MKSKKLVDFIEKNQPQSLKCTGREVALSFCKKPGAIVNKNWFYASVLPFGRINEDFKLCISIWCIYKVTYAFQGCDEDNIYFQANISKNHHPIGEGSEKWELLSVIEKRSLMKIKTPEPVVEYNKTQMFLSEARLLTKNTPDEKIFENPTGEVFWDLEWDEYPNGNQGDCYTYNDGLALISEEEAQAQKGNNNDFKRTYSFEVRYGKKIKN